MPGKVTGIRRVTAQRDTLLEPGHDGKDPKNVAAGQRSGEASRVHGNFHRLLIAIVGGTLHRGARAGSKSRRSARVADRAADAVSVEHLINTRSLDAAGDGDLGTNGRNKDDVAIEQLHVLRFVAVDEQSVQIE